MSTPIATPLRGVGLLPVTIEEITKVMPQLPKATEVQRIGRRGRTTRVMDS